MKRILLNAAILMMLGLLTACGKAEMLEESAAEATVTETAVAEMTTAETAAAETETAMAETETAVTEEGEAPHIVAIQSFPSGEQYAEGAGEAEPIALKQIGEAENHVSWAEDWMKENQLFLPILSGDVVMAEYARTLQEDEAIDYERWAENDRSFYDDTYIYAVSEVGIDIFDKATGQALYFLYFPQVMEDNYGIWAKLEGKTLYFNYFFNGYATRDTAYMMAVDVETGDILWRSKDQSCNSRTFVVKEDVILSGYGFTAEKDYLYQIDKHTGRVVDKTDIATMADYLIEQDGKLYVHTYNRDYIFEME